MNNEQQQKTRPTSFTYLDHLITIHETFSDNLKCKLEFDDVVYLMRQDFAMNLSLSPKQFNVNQLLVSVWARR